MPQFWSLAAPASLVLFSVFVCFYLFLLTVLGLAAAGCHLLSFIVMLTRELSLAPALPTLTSSLNQQSRFFGLILARVCEHHRIGGLSFVLSGLNWGAPHDTWICVHLIIFDVECQGINWVDQGLSRNQSRERCISSTIVVMFANLQLESTSLSRVPWCTKHRLCFLGPLFSESGCFSWLRGSMQARSWWVSGIPEV